MPVYYIVLFTLAKFFFKKTKTVIVLDLPESGVLSKVDKAGVVPSQFCKKKTLLF